MLQPYLLGTVRRKWETIGTISVTRAALTVGDTAQIASIASAARIKWEFPVVCNAVELRFQTAADADAHTFEVYASRSDVDHYSKMVHLTLTGGTYGADSSRVFVDTIAAASEVWFAAGAVIDSAQNRIARYSFDTCGYNNFLFIAPTLQANTILVVQAAGF